MRSSPMLLLLLGACPGTSLAHVHRIPLQSGGYVSDDLNEPKTRSGVTLDVDLDHATATLADGAEHVVFALELEHDAQRWAPDCTTMSGHSMLEPARISPRTFTIRGEHFSFDTLRAECGVGVRLTQSSNGDIRWLFRPR